MNRYVSEEILTLNITTRSRRTFELKDRRVENRRMCEPAVRPHPVASAASSDDTRMRELNCTQKTRHNQCVLTTICTPTCTRHDTKKCLLFTLSCTCVGFLIYPVLQTLLILRPIHRDDITILRPRSRLTKDPPLLVRGTFGRPERGATAGTRPKNTGCLKTCTHDKAPCPS